LCELPAQDQENNHQLLVQANLFSVHFFVRIRCSLPLTVKPVKQCF